MSTIEQQTLFIPPPESITTMSAPFAAITLQSLHENAVHTMSSPFNFSAEAFNLLKSSIAPFLNEETLNDIFFLPPLALSPQTPTPNRNTLRHLFESLAFINQPPTSYSDACHFFCHKNGQQYKLPPAFQQAVKKAIFELQGIQFYLDRIDSFWSAEHENYPLTNKEYMARSMATQLQCVNMIRSQDMSLSLESVDLLLRLAHLDITPRAYFYTVALTQPEYAAHIPLIGAFLITRNAEDQGEHVNPCVLYLPGVKLQQFDSIAMMKTYLATHLINPIAPQNPLPACVALRQHKTLGDLIGRGALDLQHISLSPFSTTPGFFNDHLQLLIDKHKQDITYLWSQPERLTAATTNQQQFEPRYPSNRSAFEFFSDCVINRAIPAVTAWRESQRPAVEPGDKPTSLKPIKLHFIYHQDLEDSLLLSVSNLLSAFLLKPPTLPLIKQGFFSWIVTELEHISGREVELIEIDKKSAPELYTFDYISMSVQDAIDRWEQAVIAFIERASQPTSPLDKFILLTRHNVVPGAVLGATYHKGQFAIACAMSRMTPAHEIGHMLGAKHEAGAIIYDGWWSDTIMRSQYQRSVWRADSYRFSDENREHIKAYLSQFD